MMQPRQILLHSSFCVGIGGLGWLSWHMLRSGGLANTVAAILFGLAAIRLLYEITVNRKHIPTIASASAVRRRMAELLSDDRQRRNLTPYRIVDLGAGRGELARTLALALPPADVTAVERALLPHLWLRLWQAWRGPRNLHAVQGDLFVFDCRGMQAIVLFVGRLAEAVGAKLWMELAAGSLVISNEFELHGAWPAPEIITLYTPFKTRLFVYRRP